MQRIRLVAVALIVGALMAAPIGRERGALAQPADLAPALITLDELPAGWREGIPGAENASALDGSNAFAPCGLAEIEAASAEAEQTTMARFSRGQTGPFLVHGVTRSADGSSYAEVVRRVRETTEPCEWTQTLAGQTVLWRLSVVPAPAVGEEVVALRLAGNAGLVQIEGRMVIIARGDMRSSVMLVTVGVGAARADEPLIERLARRADERLLALSGAAQ